MAADPLDFLETGDDASAEPPPVAPAAETPPSSAPPAEPGAPSAPAEATEDGRTIPLATALDWRDSLKEEKRKREALDAELKTLRERQQGPAPTVYDDPAKWEERQAQALRDIEVKTTMALSGRFAAQQHGQERVQAAMAWGAEQNQTDPLFGQKFMAQPDPYGWLVEQHRRDEQVSKLGGKTFEEAAAEWAQANGFAPAAVQQPAGALVPVPAAPAAPVPPPRSLASAPPAGGPREASISDKDILDGAIT